MAEFKFTNAEQMYREMIDIVLKKGQIVSPRGFNTMEMRGVTFRILNPNDNVIAHPVRNLNYAFMTAEWLWILTGSALRGVIQPFNKNLDIAGDLFDNEQMMPTYAGAYGPKWIEQMPYVLDSLRSDSMSRQAIVNIWRDRPRQTHDHPCTLNWQFFIRDGKLEMHTHMRSNDLWLGTPYDIFNFTQIQRWVALQLGVGVGEYVHHVGSLHIYETHFDKALQLSNTYFDAFEDELRFGPMVNCPELSELSHMLSTAAESRKKQATCSNCIANSMLHVSQMITERVDTDIAVMPYLLLLRSVHQPLVKDRFSAMNPIIEGTRWNDAFTHVIIKEK